MKKIIALDIDGTLTNSKKEITKPTLDKICLLYTSPGPRDPKTSRMPSCA